MSIAVYTSIVGGKDNIIDVRKHFKGCDLYCYTDSKIEDSKGWTIRPLDSRSKKYSDRINSRFYKCNPHLLKELKEYDYTIWIDGNLNINKSIKTIFNGFKKGFKIACRPHFARNCIYQEAVAVKNFHLEDPYRVDALVNYLRNAGYPSGNGLHEAGFLIRKNCSEVNDFNNVWFYLLLLFTQRDQLLFDYVLWREQLTCETIDRGFVDSEAHAVATTRFS